MKGYVTMYAAAMATPIASNQSSNLLKYRVSKHKKTAANKNTNLSTYGNVAVRE